VRRARAGAAVAVLAAVALASLWPLAWGRSNGGVASLVGVGVDGLTRPLIDDELPEAVIFPGTGHDGQQFYAIARHPFEPRAARDLLDSPAYRYRRILFPAVAGVLAPSGGRSLVIAMLGVSMIGVVLAAWALSRLPGSPVWLPVVVGMTPGVGVSLSLSLADALATGLALAAVAASTSRRWGWMTAALIGAVLTRETLILVAVGLAFAPGMTRRWRVVTLASPALLAGAWALWSTNALGTGMAEGAGQQLALPLAGWVQSTSSAAGLVIGLGTTLVLGLATWHTFRTGPPDRGIAIVLGLHTLLMLCLADDVTTSWINTTRVAAPVFPLAVWAIVRSLPATAEIGPTEVTVTAPAVIATA
jgi:hypothetical protein